MADSDILIASGSISSLPASNGIKSIPQIGQSPGSGCLICGCMEHVQTSAFDLTSVLLSSSLVLPPKNRAPNNSPTNKVTANSIFVFLSMFMIKIVLLLNNPIQLI